MKDKDLTIENEFFKSEKDYRLLVDKIWIHISIGGHVYMNNCNFDSNIFTDNQKLVDELNENAGFKLFE